MFGTELANKKPYKATISKISLRLAKLQELDEKAQKFRATKELQKSWTDIGRVLHY